MDALRAQRASRVARWLVVALLILVIAPVLFIAVRASGALRNVAYVDDVDSTMMLLLRLHEGGTWREMLGWLFELSNEHRMVVSRFLYMVSYGLTGTVDFTFFGVIGNLFLCVLCWLLVRTAGTTERKWIMALLLAGLMFQLQHFENFFWAGSSMDHLQVPLLAGVAIILLAHGPWKTLLLAGVFAALGMFTLAHGVAVWPVGALMLVVERRWRHLAVWAALGAVAGAVYFSGFQFNPEHHIGDFSAAGWARLKVRASSGKCAPLAMRHGALALAFGIALLVLLGWQIISGGLKRERTALGLALWAVLALALIAFGRANLGGGLAVSRYYVLSGLAWALVVFASVSRRPSRLTFQRTLLWLVPALVVFNVIANLAFAGPARGWVGARDQAVADFVRHGRDGAGPARLHPLPQHSTRVIRQVEELGLFEMPRQSEERTFSEIRADAGFPSAVDRILVDENLVTIDGWAALAGRVARPGEVHLVLRAGSSQHVLTTTAMPRPDVAAAFPREQWNDSGFRFALRRWLLPRENYEVGLLIPTARGAELVMTTQRLDLVGGPLAIETDKVAPNRIVYDQLLLRVPTATVKAAPKKFIRVSFVDPHDGLVHVDFSGAGEMTIALNAATPLDPLPRHRDRAVAYLKGSASISITGADESTNISVFAARRQPRFATDKDFRRAFDGMAQIASIAIMSQNGQFGGVRTGNVNYTAPAGTVGIHAPGVRFVGPVNIGDITAFGTATPKIELGSARDTRVIGGDLAQLNGQPIALSGVSQLRFVDGQTAQGLRRPARVNQAVLLQDGQDVSKRVAESVGTSRASKTPPP
jgi:hypothetical protein